MADSQQTDDASLYRDLRGFLRSPRADVRCEATRVVLELAQHGFGSSNGGASAQGEDDATLAPATSASSSSSCTSALLEHIPDLVPLLAKSCSLASGVDHSDEDDEEEEDEDDDRHGKSQRRNWNSSSSVLSARAAIYALKALLVLTSNSGGPASATQRCVEELLDSSASGMNRMMEILLTAPPPATSRASNRGDDGDKDPLNLWRQLVNYAMALVANMTRNEEGAVELVGRSLPDEAVASASMAKGGGGGGGGGGAPARPAGESEADLQQQQQQQQQQQEQQQLPLRGEGARLPNKPTVELLLARFLNVAQYADPAVNYRAMLQDRSAADPDGTTTDAALASHPGDPFQHYASVLMNVTQVEPGRLFVLKIRRGPTQQDKDGLGHSVLQALLPQLRSSNPLRRRGVAGTIRNCCLDTDFTWWLLNVVKISTHLLYPLAGPEELDVDEKRGLDPDLWLEGPDKEREPDRLTRLYLVEAMLFLASSGRQAQGTLRRERVSVVLKWAEMVEEQEDVSEKMVECMNLLRDDNKHAEESDERGGDLEDDHTSNIGTPAPAKEVGLSDNYDDVD